MYDVQRFSMGMWAGLLLLTGISAFPLAAEETSWAEFTADTVRPLLEEHQKEAPIPELAAEDLQKRIASEWGGVVAQWAKSAEPDIPETTQDLYLEFKRSGARPPYERPYFGKRERLTRFALAAWMHPETANIDHVAALLESVLDEPTWVAPAHERKEPWNIDLFASETACDLAHLLLILGDRLPAPLVERTRKTIQERILDPYLDHHAEYWWDAGRNNWTGVCAGAVGQTFLLLDTDPARQAQAIEAVLGQFSRFIEHGFEEDGACLEGVGYWNYGLSHFVSLAEMLRVRTGGAVDILAHPKLRRIATYPAQVALGPHVFAAFSDSHERSALTPYIASRLAERTEEPALLTQMGGPESWRLAGALRNLLWADAAQTPPPTIRAAYLPGSGIIKLVGEASGRPLVLAAKAGHNAEPHNNDDVGSFILRAGDTTYLCDPGAGLYSKDYFSIKRYENIFANSYGHSVPRINSELQGTGAKYAGALEKESDRAFHIRLDGAYAAPELTLASRRFELHPDGHVSLQTHYELDAPVKIEEAFITWLDAAAEGPVVRVSSPEGVLEIRTDAGKFAVERLEDACRANHKKEVLSRITLTKEDVREWTQTYEIRFLPATAP